jgi:hypothetical protein
LIQFLGEEGREKEGSKSAKHLPKPIFAFPQIGGFGGERREAFINFSKLSKLSSLYFHILILSLLQFLLLY